MRVKNLCSAKVLRSDEIAASSEAITNGTRGTALGIRKARKRSSAGKPTLPSFRSKLGKLP